MWYPVWSILVCKIPQFWAKATNWDCPSYFYYVLFPKGSQKKISAHVLITVCRGVYIHYFEINPCNFFCLLFSENYLNRHVRINKMVNKHTADYHPSPAQLISRIHHLIFLWIPKGFISPESLLNFFLNLYIPLWLWKFLVLILQGNTFVSQKIESVYFYSCPQVDFSTMFLSLSSRQRLFSAQAALLIPPKQCFLKVFFSEQKGRRGLWS